MATLGVNIDHIATVRQARGGIEPDPVQAAAIAERAGAHGITAHLREDRRHINDRDIFLLKKNVKTHLNLEMACTPEMVRIALKVHPWMVTLVPEKRAELTTEGGLLVHGYEKKLAGHIKKLRAENILVSTFITPDDREIRASRQIGATHIELHTGPYANAAGSKKGRTEKIKELRNAVGIAHGLGLRINAGHGLNYVNVTPIAELGHVEELNIGHSIVSRACLVGLNQAIVEMLSLIKTSRAR